MTEQNDKTSETFQTANKRKLLLLFEMWCENINFTVLGNSVHDCVETDCIQKQCGTNPEGLVDST